MTGSGNDGLFLTWQGLAIALGLGMAGPAKKCCFSNGRVLSLCLVMSPGMTVWQFLSFPFAFMTGSSSSCVLMEAHGVDVKTVNVKCESVGTP